MAITNTRLSAAASKSDDTFKLVSSTGATVGGFCKVNGEYSIVTAINTPANSVTVRARGDRGGKVNAHVANSPVTLGVASDQPEWMYGTGSADVDDVVSMSVAGTFTPANRHTKLLINGPAAIAVTIAAPAGIADGIRLTVIQDTVMAHVITVTGVQAATDLYTFVGTLGGGSLTLEAWNGAWRVIAVGGTTVA